MISEGSGCLADRKQDAGRVDPAGFAVPTNLEHSDTDTWCMCNVFFSCLFISRAVFFALASH